VPGLRSVRNEISQSFHYRSVRTGQGMAMARSGKRRKAWARWLAIGAALTLLSGTANADAGVPLLFVTFPAMVLALIPVILVETVVVVRMLKLRAWPAAKPVAVANLASTFVGIPLTWLALVLLEIATTGGGRAYGLDTPRQKFLSVVWQAPWLIPYGTDLSWMIPTASLVLLVPFFFASYWVESWVVSAMLHKHSVGPVKPAVFRANLASYALLVAFNIVWLIWSVKHPISG
jgi:hypothetical protein